MKNDKELKEAIKAYIRKQIAAGNGGRIWYAMMHNAKAAMIEVSL